MNRIRRIIWFSALASVSAFFSVGCGGDSEEQATADWLQQNGYELTISDYLLAAEAGDLEALELFRERGIEVDQQDADSGDTALIRAAGTGQMEAMRHLLSEGADATLTNRAGRSALLLASQEGHPEAVRLLLSHGADPKAKDRDGWNALTVAAYQGREGVVEILAGKMQDQLDDALLIASLQGNAGVVDQLLNRGAYVNTRSDADQTPLMLAAKAGHFEVVQLLMTNGANPYSLDRSDATAASLAKRGGHVEVSEYLLLPPGSSAATTAAAAAEELSEVADADSSIDGAVIELPPSEGDMPLEGDLVLAGEEETVSDARIASASAAGETGPATERAEDSQQSPVASDATPVAEATTLLADATVDADAAGAPASPAPATEQPQITSSANAPSTAESRDSASTGGRKRAAPGRDSGGAARTPLDSMKLDSYREKPLPVMLADVEDGSAEVRVLAGPAAREAIKEDGDATIEPVRVSQGEMISGTPYRVTSVSTKYVSSKEGKGELVDVSRMTVENTDTGEKHLLVKGVPGRSQDVYAVVVMQPGDQRYVVHERDRFTAINSRDKVEEFQVLEIRPTQVLIENLDTRRVTTIEHDGVAMR